MKITKKQLTRIIKESINEIDVGDNFGIGNADSRGTDHLFSKSEVESLVDMVISNATLVAEDLATANRDRGSARTALVLRAIAANKKVLEQLQILKKVAEK